MEKESASNKSRVVVENGEIKTILSEDVLRDGYMSVEEACRLTHEEIDKLCDMLMIPRNG